VFTARPIQPAFSFLVARRSRLDYEPESEDKLGTMLGSGPARAAPDLSRDLLGPGSPQTYFTCADTLTQIAIGLRFLFCGSRVRTSGYAGLVLILFWRHSRCIRAGSPV